MKLRLDIESRGRSPRQMSCGGISQLPAYPAQFNVGHPALLRCTRHLFIQKAPLPTSKTKLSSSFATVALSNSPVPDVALPCANVNARITLEDFIL